MGTRMRPTSSITNSTHTSYATLVVAEEPLVSSPHSRILLTWILRAMKLGCTPRIISVPMSRRSFISGQLGLGMLDIPGILDMLCTTIPPVIR
jgi:hypothetical protein